VSLSRLKGTTNITRNVLAGAVGLGATGFLIGQVVGKNNESTSYSYSKESNDSDLKILLPVAGVVAGAGFGAILTPKREEEFYPLSQMTWEQKSALLSSLVVRHEQKRDTASSTNIVYLKNGSIIRGTVIEMIPDSLLKVRTTDASLFVFRMSEVVKVAKPENTERTNFEPSSASVSEIKTAISPNNQSTGSNGYQNPFEMSYERRVHASVRAGVAIPTGDFGATTGSESGAASVGFQIAADLLFPIDPASSVGGNVTVAINSLDVGGSVPTGVDIGSWSSIWLMLAGQIQTTNFSSTQGYLQSRLGLVVVSPPSVTSSVASVEYSTATSFAYGIAGGLIFSEHLKLEAAFMGSRPEFTATLHASGQQASGTGRLPVNIVMLSLGYSF
jgi:hypothetical protein